MLSSVTLKLNYFPGQCFSARIARNDGFKKLLHLNMIQTCAICTSAREGTPMEEG
jgi:hypothetical protein